MTIAYINVEDTLGTDYLEELSSNLIDDFDNITFEVVEVTEYYLVLKVEYEEYEELQEICSTACYMLIGNNVNRFTFTINN